MSVFSLVYGEGVHELSDTIINDNSTSRTEIHLLEDRLAPKSGPKSVSIGITINKIYVDFFIVHKKLYWQTICTPQELQQEVV